MICWGTGVSQVLESQTSLLSALSLLRSTPYKSLSVQPLPLISLDRSIGLVFVLKLSCSHRAFNGPASAPGNSLLSTRLAMFLPGFLPLLASPRLASFVTRPSTPFPNCSSSLLASGTASQLLANSAHHHTFTHLTLTNSLDRLPHIRDDQLINARVLCQGMPQFDQGREESGEGG